MEIAKEENQLEMDRPLATAYEPPALRTFTSEEILAEIGPAQACTKTPDPPGKRLR